MGKLKLVGRQYQQPVGIHATRGVMGRDWFGFVCLPLVALLPAKLLLNLAADLEGRIPLVQQPTVAQMQIL